MALGQVKTCPTNYLCANACGLSENEAIEDARVEIAKNFQVKVKAKFTSIESTIGKLDEGEYSDYVSEEVNENIFGVETLESYLDADDYHCVLMGLNKSRFVTKIKSDIESLKTENEELIKSGLNLVMSKVRVNNSVIKKLDLYLATLTDKYRSNVKKHANPAKKEIKIKFYSRPKFSAVEKILMSELNKDNVYTGDSEPELKISIALLNEYLNVEGFIKRTMEINFIKNKINITKRYTQSGRSEEAIIEKVISELVDDIPDLFINLKI